MKLFLNQLVLEQFFLVPKKPSTLPGKFPLLWVSVNPIQENPETEEEKYNAETPHQLSL